MMHCIACQTDVDIYSEKGIWVARAMNPANLESGGISLVICSDDCYRFKLDEDTREAFIKVQPEPQQEEVTKVKEVWEGFPSTDGKVLIKVTKGKPEKGDGVEVNGTMFLISSDAEAAVLGVGFNTRLPCWKVSATNPIGSVEYNTKVIEFPCG